MNKQAIIKDFKDRLEAATKSFRYYAKTLHRQLPFDQKAAVEIAEASIVTIDSMGREIAKLSAELLSSNPESFHDAQGIIMNFCTMMDAEHGQFRERALQIFYELQIRTFEKIYAMEEIDIVESTIMTNTYRPEWNILPEDQVPIILEDFIL
jgi:hypothetical protein